MDEPKQKKIRSKDLVVQNKVGLHLRAAKTIADVAGRFRSEITFAKDGYTVNAKSILGLASLYAPRNTILTCLAVGPDASEALAAVERVFLEKFYEE